MTTFDLLEAVRKTGAYQSRRTYLDFVLHGESLKDLLRAGDFVTPLCYEWQTGEVTESIGRLLLQRPTGLPGGRVPVYVCGECGDVGCGVISAEISRSSDAIIWQDFGYENKYDNDIVRDPYAHVGPLVFTWSQYEGALTSAALRWLPKDRREA